MKQISDKVNLAVRRFKRKGKKITAAEARNSEYLDTLVNLDEGERGGSVVECRTPEREVRGSRPTAAVLCP